MGSGGRVQTSIPGMSDIDREEKLLGWLAVQRRMLAGYRLCSYPDEVSA